MGQQVGRVYPFYFLGKAGAVAGRSVGRIRLFCLRSGPLVHESALRRPSLHKCAGPDLVLCQRQGQHPVGRMARRRSAPPIPYNFITLSHLY